MSTKVITGLVRFSYVHAFEPTATANDDSAEPKYSVSIIIDKSDKKTIAAIEAAIEEAKQLGKNKLADSKGRIPANIKTPLRDGDIDKPYDDAYAGSLFLTASSFRKPGVVGESPECRPLSKDEFYSGCYGRASINFYAFNKKGNRGIACGLSNLQKLEDGDRLDGGSSAAEDFGGEFNNNVDDLM